MGDQFQNRKRIANRKQHALVPSGGEPSLIGGLLLRAIDEFRLFGSRRAERSLSDDVDHLVRRVRFQLQP